VFHDCAGGDVLYHLQDKQVKLLLRDTGL